MGKSQHTIDINANIKTQLQGMDKVVREFQNGLSNGMSKIDMTKGVGKDLSKLISKFENDFSKINSLISLDNKISLGDSKEFQKYGDSIISVFRDIQRVANDLGQKGLIDAKKLFPEAFDSKVSEMLSQLGRLKSSFIELAQKEASVVKLQGEISDLTSKITELKTASDNFDNLKQNFEESAQQAEEATKNVEALKKSVIALGQKKLLDDDSLEDTEKAAKALRGELEKLKTKGVTTGKGGHATFNGKNMTEWRAIEKEGTGAQKQEAQEVIELLKEYNLLNNELRTHNRLLEENARLKQLLDNGGPSSKKDVQDLAKIVGEKDAIKEAYAKQAEAADKAAKAQEELNNAEGAAERAVGLTQELEKKNRKLRETEAAIKALKTATDFSQIAAELNKIEGIKVDESMLKSAEGLAWVVKQLEGLDEKAFSELKETLQGLGITLPDASQNVKEFSGSLEEAGDKAKELDDNLSEMKALKSRITQFFGLTNAINLFKRTVSNAINSVKELDAVMTETAVVTEFSIGDMWEKLPEYAAHADSLGSSIRDVYAATTLYYQQGLKTNEAMGVGVETMKMARIANLEAGDATQYMTAALRGFNMEVNEMNAQRVNDVYSELAAITAADTAQIATAMSKTASIAASANMEFETTAALLAQIIETTQEAPETAGTALKTIIARFSEVKKLREEGQMTGEDEEGEVIDVNKIQGALRTVGISMDDFFAGAEGLDSIFLKLAEKWDTLDFKTQRYIATTAAGSRQQSRFIAMMSDYGRTMELAAAANDSAGASQEQFGKTLESLDAKTQKLKTAWQEFVMGLANSEIIKSGVDILTFLLKAINKVVDGLSGKNGIAKSIITLNLAVTAIGGIRAALGKLFDSKLLKTIGSAFTQISDESQKTGITAGDNISKGVKSGLDQAVQDSVTAGQQIAQNLSGPSENLRFSQEDLFIGPPLPPEWQKKPGGTEGGSGNQQGETVDTSSTLEKNAKSAQNAKEANIALTGTLITLTGTALNWGSTALKTNEDTESLGHAMQGMGTAASAAGSAMTMLAPIIAKTGLSLGALNIYAVAIIALVGALVYAFKEIEKASPEGKLKAAQESAQEAAQAADAAAESYQNLASSLESIEGKETALDELTVGTQEWRDAVTELNNEILELINLYPELSDYTSFENGVLKISEKGKKLVLDKQRAAVQGTQTAKIASQIEVQKAQQKVGFKNLDSNLKVQKGTSIVSAEDNPTISNEYLRRAQAEYGLEPHYGSSAAFPNQAQANQPTVPQTVVIEYDEEKTQELAKIYARGDFDPNKAFEAGGELEFLANRSEEELAEFKRYGQELIASEGAIKVFTNSLLNNAIVNGEIEQKYSDAMMKIADSAQIEEMVEKAAEDINPEDEITKEKYAKAMGYQYDTDEKKFYSGFGENKKEVAVTKKDIKDQLAYMEVVNTLTEKMQTLEGVIDSLANKTDNASQKFANLMDSEKGGWTTKQIADNRGSLSWMDEIWEANQDELLKVYESEAEFRVAMAKEQGEITVKQSLNEEKLKKFNAEEMFRDIEVPVEFASDITDSLYKAFIVAGGEKAESLSKILQETFSKLQPDQAAKFAQKLAELDWSSVDELNEFKQELINTGIVTNETSDSFDNIINQIKSVMKAVNKFDLTKFKEELTKAQEFRKDLKSRDANDRIYSKELYDAIIAGNDKLEDDFIMTGIDEYTYLGDSIDPLVVALDANTAALLGEGVESTQNKAVDSQKWIDAYEKDKMQSVNQDAKDKSLFGEIEYSFSDIMSKILGGQLVSVDQVQTLLSTVGADTSGNLDELIARAIELYNANYGDGGVVAQQNVEGAKEINQLADYEKYKNMNADQVASSGGSDQFVREAMQREAEDADLDVQEVVQYSNALKEAYKLEQQMADRIAIDNAKMNKGVKELSENWDEWSKVLKSDSKGSQEYSTTINKVRSSMKNLLNISGDLSEKFLTNEKNLKLMKKAAQGNVQAIKMLKKEAMKDIVAGMKLDPNAKKKITTEIENILDSEQYDKIEIGTALDDTPFYNALQGMLDAGLITQEQMNSILEGIGFEPSIQMEEVTVDSINTANQTAEVLGPDGEKRTVKLTEEMQTGATVMVPRIGNSKFKGSPKKALNPGNKKPPAKGGGGKKGGGGSKEKWENPYDKQYNLVQKINAELRKREKLERRYQELVAKSGTTVSQLQKNTEKEVAAVKKEMGYRETLLKRRKSEMSSYENKNKKYQKYAHYDEKLGEVVIDWSAINKIKDADYGAKVEKYISKLEDIESQIQEEEDKIAEQTEILRDIYDRGKDEYFDLENQVKEAIIGERQAEIDKLSAINDSINETNSRLISAMQESVEKYRQDRENQRTEEELSDKQRRLAYLQQDTSGANALEIMQLQEEIDQGMEDYTDKLIDQKINDLQQQNDEAAEQREKQIAIAEAQLKKSQETGEIWNEVYKVLNDGLVNKGIKPGSELEQLLKEGSEFEQKSSLEKMEWQENIENIATAAQNWLKQGNSIQAQLDTGKISKGKSVTFTTKDGKKVTGAVQSNGTVKSSSGEVYEDVYQNYDGSYITTENYIAPKKKTTTTTSSTTKNPSNAPKLTDKIKRGVSAAIWNGNYGWGTGSTRAARLKEVFGKNDIQEEYVAKKKTTGYTGSVSDYSYSKMKKKFTQYKTGGLADFTGPAWLDGTKSKPEYILNAEQTKSFFELVDVLGSLKSGTNQSSQITGDSIYDVDINVESIGSDYDVEQLATTIKRMINDDARYRNNNAINLQR